LSFVIPLRGGLRKKSQVQLAGDLEVRIPTLFKVPLRVSRGEVLGWIASADLAEPENLPVWKRVPELRALPSGQGSGRFDITVLFRRPVRLPRLTLSAYQVMEVTRKQEREGILVDGVALQVRDPEQAQRLLTGWGAGQFTTLEEAFNAQVGVEADPIAAQHLKEERNLARHKELRKLYWYSRLGAVAIFGQLVLRMWEGEAAGLQILAAVALGGAFAFLFAAAYRSMRFGFKAPEQGRSHRRVIAAMTPPVAAGLAGLFALRSADCFCSFPPLVQMLVFLAPAAWMTGAFAAGFGMLGTKQPQMKRPGSTKQPKPLAATGAR